MQKETPCNPSVPEQQWPNLLPVRPGEDAWYELGDAQPWFSRNAYLRIKRLFDVLACLLLMPVILPLLAILGAALWLDSPGPLFFVQRRTGKGGRRFRMYKLRTMVAGAEELKEKLRHLNQLSYPDFKIKDDPRITRMGRFLRKSSLDELPQFFNVLKGDMSLVGPRPTSFGPQTYRLWHTARLELVPGLTGLWQVSGRCQVEFDQRLRLDIAYHRNQCLSLDLKILLRTVTCVLDGKGAD